MSWLDDLKYCRAECMTINADSIPKEIYTLIDAAQEYAKAQKEERRIAEEWVAPDEPFTDYTQAEERCKQAEKAYLAAALAAFPEET